MVYYLSYQSRSGSACLQPRSRLHTFIDRRGGKVVHPGLPSMREVTCLKASPIGANLRSSGPASLLKKFLAGAGCQAWVRFTINYNSVQITINPSAKRPQYLYALLQFVFIVVITATSLR